MRHRSVEYKSLFYTDYILDITNAGHQVDVIAINFTTNSELSKITSGVS